MKTSPGNQKDRKPQDKDKSQPVKQKNRKGQKENQPEIINKQDNQGREKSSYAVQFESKLLLNTNSANQGYTLFTPKHYAGNR